MIYCINPECKQRQNSDELEYCQTCGTPLLIQERYRLIQPLRELNLRSHTEIFEVDDGDTRKVMKVLKDNNPQLVRMFEREALTLQELNHRGVPKVDIDGYFTFTPKDSTQELHCLVMEKIEGQNLEEWLAKNKPISQSQAINWLRQLIEILDQIHQHGFFHRDIKPSNIILQPDGRLALIDFGSVRDISDTYLAKIKVKNGLNITTIFSGGYTPQEQVDGKATPQSDWFALGRTFVHLLAGKSPVELPTNSKTGKLIWQDQAPQISKPLADFIDDELMAPSPADRPQDTAVVLRYLTAKGLFLRSILRLVNSPRLKFVVAGLLTMGIAGLGIYWKFVLPLQAQAHSDRGRKALMDERLDSARKDLEKAVELNPNKATFHNDLGLVCKLQKEFECALDQYRKALNLKPNPVTVATIHYNLGVLYEDRREFEAALRQYKIAMQDKGEIGVNATNNFVRLQILRKQILRKQILHKHKNSLAIDIIQKALERTENTRLKSTLYKNLGWAYLQEGNPREAEKYLREAIRLDKDKRAAAHCLMARVLQESDKSDKVKALASWKNCRDLDSEKLPEVETWQLDAFRYLNAKK